MRRDPKHENGPGFMIAVVEDDPAKANEIAKTLPGPFKLRGQLEVFLAVCEKSSEPSPDALQELEANDKVGTTLALAWFALAQRRANRDTTRKLLDDRLAYVQLPPAIVEQIRPMVDIGSYLGSAK